jgi:hypothetical protein
MNRVPFHRAPRPLRRPGVSLDNIAIVPASLLPQKATYQAIANRLPKGEVLVVLPQGQGIGRRAIELTVQQFRARGRRVTTLTTTARSAEVSR